MSPVRFLVTPHERASDYIRCSLAYLPRQPVIAQEKPTKESHRRQIYSPVAREEFIYDVRDREGGDREGGDKEPAQEG